MRGYGVLSVNDDNICSLRERYADGLTFVVGDTHGEGNTLQILMEKIRFDPDKDHVFFVGDYNSGSSVYQLLKYISAYYSEDYGTPGFHLIRGNHEHELEPSYPLENMPDIIVLRRKQLNYYIAHAGMISVVFGLINSDMAAHPAQNIFAYRLDSSTVCHDAPLKQIIWSRRGLYSQKSRPRSWPEEESLYINHACIIHGHTPYCFFVGDDDSVYGENSLFFQNQRVFFSESLQSFDIDSNIKGLYNNGETYRGLSCVCLEALEETAAANYGVLTVEGIRNSENAVFSAAYVTGWSFEPKGDICRVLKASPEMKTITLGEYGDPVLTDDRK